MYKNLSKIYHMDYENYNQIYQTRFGSEYSIHTHFDINGNEAFYLVTPEILDLIVKIYKSDKENTLLVHKLPGIAIKQLSKKFLIDEITITNDIEGVNSSRKEINNIIDGNKNKIKDVKFYDLVQKYTLLSKNKNIKINTCMDVRNLYNELVLQDVVKENKNNKPDGMIFRKNEVEVWNNGRVIHHGLMPEENIINHIEVALNHLNDSDVNTLLKAAAFHYLLGYVHPFYDGNGRLNRFISSYMIATDLNPLISYMLSYTIKSSIKDYYANFKICDDVLSKGDITPFINYFMSTIYTAENNLCSLLNEKNQAYIFYQDKIQKLEMCQNKHILRLVHLLMQAELFAENGISISELLYETQATIQTLRKRLHIVKSANLLKETILNKRKYYQLNLDKLNELKD